MLGGGFDLVTIGGRAYVRSVPGELNLDKNRALEAAQVRDAPPQGKLKKRLIRLGVVE